MAVTSFSVGVLLFLFRLGGSHGKVNPCDEGWEPYGDRCIKIIKETLSWNDAWLNCKLQGANASLSEIPDADANQHLSEFISGTGSDYWIGINSAAYQRITYIGSGKYESLSYSHLVWNATTKALKRSYTNFKQSVSFTYAGIERRCGYTDDAGFWYTSSCAVRKRSLCTKDKVCQSDNENICKKQCHCYLSDCDSETRRCKNGCQAGWQGDRCDTRKVEADVAIFCFHSETDGKIALIRVNPLGVNYQAISIVDSDGHRSCTQTMFQREIDGTLHIRLQIYDNGQTQPNCPHNSSGDDIYTWAVRTEEWIGLLGKYDRQYDLKCDFKIAETRVRNTSQIVDGGMNTNPVKVNQTTENVELFIRNPVTSGRLSEVSLGSQIILSMVLHKTDATMTAKSISPYNCFVANVNGTVKRQLINERGCPVNGSPVSALKATTQTSFNTKPFEAFTLYNHSVVVFSCEFEFCFHENTPLCTDRCSASYTYSMRGRRRRSTDDSNERVHSSTKAYLRFPNGNF